MEEALLQSYDLDNILQPYHRVSLKFCVAANITFSGELNKLPKALQVMLLSPSFYTIIFL